MRSKLIVRIIRPSETQLAYNKTPVELRCGHRVLIDETVSSEHSPDMAEPCPRCDWEERKQIFAQAIEGCTFSNCTSGTSDGTSDDMEARCDADYRIPWDWRPWAILAVAAIGCGLAMLMGGVQ